MRLWLLDADIIIDLLTFGMFDNLVERHEVYAAAIVINEVKSYKRDENRATIDFRKKYVLTGKVSEVEASSDEINSIMLKMPPIWRETIHAGEIESLAIMAREDGLVICSCDAAVIRALPFLNLSERGISAEKLIKESGLKKISLEVKHTEKYFQNNLKTGRIRWIQNM